MALLCSRRPVRFLTSLPSTHTHTTTTQNRFLLSTHYTNYNPWLFAINLSALIFVLVPKLPIVRFYIVA